MAETSSLDEAIDAFVQGYCFQRAFNHPYLCERREGIWRLFDAPRSKGSPRREEFVCHGMAPEKVHRAVVKRAQGHYCLCPIHVDGEDLDGLRDEYKSLGYRLNGTEFFMVHGLKRIPRVDAPVPLEPVTTPEMVARLAKRAARRQILTEHLTEDPAPQRSYVALIDDLIVGWVNSIVTDEAAYCGGMYVYPEFRRRGIARSLLARMLRDDRAGGAQQAVLLASHAGAKLYPVVGYRQLGTMMVLTPKRR